MILTPLVFLLPNFQVTWVEHLECQRSTVHSLYRTTVNSGLAFGAKHWISTLQQQCDRLVFLVATNVPVKDSSGNELIPQKSIQIQVVFSCYISCSTETRCCNACWEKKHSEIGTENEQDFLQSLR